MRPWQQARLKTGRGRSLKHIIPVFVPTDEDSAHVGGNPDSNTLLSDMTTVICLDDYHCLDRYGRKEKKVTALDPVAQDFDLMYEQTRDLKEGKPVQKPIYNHVSGLLDPPEEIKSPNVRPSPWLTSCHVYVFIDLVRYHVIHVKHKNSWWYTGAAYVSMIASCLRVPFCSKCASLCTWLQC